MRGITRSIAAISILAMLPLAACGLARAEVMDHSPDGFTIAD